MLDQGLVEYETPQLRLRLVKSSGTVAALEPRTTQSTEAPRAPKTQTDLTSLQRNCWRPDPLTATTTLETWIFVCAQPAILTGRVIRLPWRGIRRKICPLPRVSCCATI
jgi:hypothetical protein